MKHRNWFMLVIMLMAGWLALPVSAQWVIVNGVVQFSGLRLSGTGIISPSADSTTAVRVTKADRSTAVLTFDTTNNRATFGGTVLAGPSVAGILSTGLIAGNAAILGWTAQGNAALTGAGATFDTGLARNAAGVVEVNTGTAGTYAPLKAARYDAQGTTAVAVANVGANSCGTSAASIAGNDNVGAITVGATSGTQCRITFTVAAPTRRHCTFDDESTTIALRSTYVDTTHTDVLGALIAGDVISYVCIAR